MKTSCTLATALLLAAGTAVSAQSLTPPNFALAGNAWAYAPDYSQQLTGPATISAFRLIATAQPVTAGSGAWQSDVELKLASPNGTTLILGGSGANWTNPAIFLSGTTPANSGNAQQIDATFSHNFGPLDGIWNTNFYNTWSSGDITWTNIEIIPIELTTGACCLEDGTCQQLTSFQCASAGGVYSGDGSDCATIPPCAQPGACCLTTGGCMLSGSATCAAAGGTFHGAGTDCATICPPPADMLVPPSAHPESKQWAYTFDYSQMLSGGKDIQAVRLVATADQTLPGAWQNDMQMRLESPNGAVLLIGSGAGIAWNQAGVLLTGTPPAGSANPGAIDATYVFNFGNIDGVWKVNFFNDWTSGQIFWNNIQVIPVELVTGACCLPDGGCLENFESQCANIGGVFSGANTECATIPPCPQPATGACCLNDGSCVVDWSVGCANQGGTYMGDDVLCSSVTCPTSLVTDPPNNGLTAAGSGLFMDLTATDALTIPRIDYVASAAAGTPTIVEIWTKPGSYVGFDGDPTPWVLHDTVFSNSAGTSERTQMLLANPLIIEASETIGVYLLTQAGGIRYTGATGAQPNHSDANLALFSDLVRGGPWSGSTFTPRVFSGAIYYTLGGSQLCYANCDTSTIEPILNVDDFTCFINEFAQAQNLPHAQQVTHYANCDGSTIAPVLNVDDFTCFINEFAAGCP